MARFYRWVCTSALACIFAHVRAPVRKPVHRQNNCERGRMCLCLTRWCHVCARVCICMQCLFERKSKCNLACLHAHPCLTRCGAPSMCAQGHVYTHLCVCARALTHPCLTSRSRAVRGIRHDSIRHAGRTPACTHTHIHTHIGTHMSTYACLECVCGPFGAGPHSECCHRGCLPWLCPPHSQPQGLQVEGSMRRMLAQRCRRSTPPTGPPMPPLALPSCQRQSAHPYAHRRRQSRGAMIGWAVPATHLLLHDWLHDQLGCTFHAPAAA